MMNFRNGNNRQSKHSESPAAAYVNKKDKRGKNMTIIGASAHTGKLESFLQSFSTACEPECLCLVFYAFPLVFS